MTRHSKTTGDNIKHLPVAIDRAECSKHKVPVGVPCWDIRTDKGHGRRLPAICNQRAMAAGYNGKIEPASLGFGRFAPA